MQNNQKYACRQFGNRYVVSIANHTEICVALEEFCREHSVTCGTIIGIGAVNTATLRFFDPHTKDYVDKTFDGQMEISNLTGNISTKDGELYMHMHVTLGREDYITISGHLLCAILSGAGEFVVEKFDGELNRRYDSEIGLNVYDL